MAMRHQIFQKSPVFSETAVLMPILYKNVFVGNFLTNIFIYIHFHVFYNRFKVTDRNIILDIRRHLVANSCCYIRVTMCMY